MRGLVLCAALVFFAVATSVAKARIVDQAANGFTVENSQWVPTDPAASWKALVDDVGKWWPADHTWWGDASKLSISQKVGGCFCEMHGTRQAWHMTVAFVDPGKTMRMTGGLGPLQGMGLGGALEWRFAEENGGTRITLWYRAGGYTPDDLTKFVPVIDQVQGLQLGGLADYLRKQHGETGSRIKIKSTPPQSSPALRAREEARAGLPPAQKLMNSPPFTGTLAPVM